jgi:hypothetical protein
MTPSIPSPPQKPIEERYEKLQKEHTQLWQRNRDLGQEISKLKDQLEISQTLEGRDLLKNFPDTHYHTSRWGTRRLTSKLANAKCTDIDIGHNCGCCNDSPIEVWPYFKVGELKLYAAGIPFSPGESWDHVAERPYEGWEEQFIKNQIPEGVINKVQVFFDENRIPDEEED